MKYIRLFVFALFFAPFTVSAATNEFMVAAQLLAAAKNADIQQVQTLVNAGADINFVDNTGLSLVCTALLNNDIRAAQILQMYGADASKCDRQIKNFKSKTPKSDSGGLFSGLSSAQRISLAAAGAAVIVGGLFLLTDVFDPDNGNSNSSSGGNRPGGDGDNGAGGNAGTEYLRIPYGPAYLTADGKIDYTLAVYQENLNKWNPTAGGLYKADWDYFNNYPTDADVAVQMQNYLLMMHGYSAFANGYMGQATFRNDTNAPLKIANATSGGRPMLVSLITDNGVNAAGSLGRQNGGDIKGITYAASASGDAATTTVDKYLNYNAPVENVFGTEKTGFDLSGAGTAMNPFATLNQNALGKIVAGWVGGRASDVGDLYGFVPNGRLAVYRTGAGYEWIDKRGTDVVGTVTNGAGGDETKIDVGDTIKIGDNEYLLSAAVTDSSITNPTITINGKTFQVAAGSTMMVGKCAGENCDDISDIALYRGTDGFYYFNTTGGANADAVYVLDGDNLYTQKELVASDIKTFQAMYNAVVNLRADADAYKAAAAVANATVNPDSYKSNYYTVRDMPTLLNLSGNADAKNVFAGFINKFYDKTDSKVQGAYAGNLFQGYNTDLPIIVMPAGGYEFSDGTSGQIAVPDATFENYAPVLYGENLEHMFMTIVAVQHTDGTSGAESISDYGNGTGNKFGPLQLSVWGDADAGILYRSRKCGVAGVGINGIDPWCFAAAGATSEMAVASASGAVAAIKGAFNYMTNDQVFTLLALTADGYLLATDDAGNRFTADTLAAYLQGMYALPPEYNVAGMTPDAYLNAFADVYGYGLINLERAMTPQKGIFYYDGKNIVSAAGNMYWRAAANTTFRSSSALAPRVAKISAPFYDVIESADGAISMPRVWKNEFDVGAGDRRGLYMGDVLGELRTRDVVPNRTQVGNIGFSMTVSPREYNDNMSGLDDIRIDFTTGNWEFAAGYQRHLIGDDDRFSGRANPIMALASNAVMSSVAYNMGRWEFEMSGFSGAITDEGLLETDPTLASQYMPADLGAIVGATNRTTWNGDNVNVGMSFGVAREENTFLGAQTGGLLNIGGGDTVYAMGELGYMPTDDVRFVVRATFARTSSDANGQFIVGMSDVVSNAFSFGADVGAFNVTASLPLAAVRGDLQYATADYDVVEDNGKYNLVVDNMRVENVDLGARAREVRLGATYRHNFGEFTDGALGWIYRINPNHTREFGNESIFMMKLTHRLGI